MDNWLVSKVRILFHEMGIIRLEIDRARFDRVYVANVIRTGKEGSEEKKKKKLNFVFRIRVTGKAQSMRHRA